MLEYGRRRRADSGTPLGAGDLRAIPALVERLNAGLIVLLRLLVIGRGGRVNAVQLDVNAERVIALGIPLAFVLIRILIIRSPVDAREVFLQGCRLDESAGVAPQRELRVFSRYRRRRRAPRGVARGAVVPGGHELHGCEDRRGAHNGGGDADEERPVARLGRPPPDGRRPLCLLEQPLPKW